MVSTNVVSVKVEFYNVLNTLQQKRSFGEEVISAINDSHNVAEDEEAVLVAFSPAYVYMTPFVPFVRVIIDIGDVDFSKRRITRVNVENAAIEQLPDNVDGNDIILKVLIQKDITCY